MARFAVVVCGLWVLVGWAVESLPLEFEGEAVWRPRPTFLGNAASAPEVAVADGVAQLTVREPGKGMKFEAAVRPWRSDRAPYLLVRYRASDLAGGYALWVFDASRDGGQILGVAELRQDGQWQLVAVDLAGRGVRGAVRSLLTEVQCRTRPASIAFDFIRPVHEVPPGCLVVGAGDAVPEAVLRFADLPRPEAQPSWLQERAAAHEVEVEDGGVLRLGVDGLAEQGMKWSVRLPEPLDLSAYAFAAVRYRARGSAPHGDYFVWLGSDTGGLPPQSQVLLPLRSLTVDGEWHVAVVALTGAFVVKEVALQARTAGGKADLWLDTVRFAARRPAVALGDMLPVAAGEGASVLPAGEVRFLSLRGREVFPPAAAARLFGLTDWFPEGVFTARGIAFRGGDAACGGLLLDGAGELVVPVGMEAGEVYLLLASDPPVMDAARMGDPVPLQRFSAPERFVVRVVYADGTVDEAFPCRRHSGAWEVVRGVDVYVLPGLRGEAIRELVLVNRCASGAFLVAAVTLNQGDAATVPTPVFALPPPALPITAYPGNGGITAEAFGYAVFNDLIHLELGTGSGLTVRGVETACLVGRDAALRAGPLFEVDLGDGAVGSDRWVPGRGELTRDGDVARLVLPLDGREAGVPLTGELLVTLGDADGIRLELDLVNASDRVLRPEVRFPILRDVCLGTAAETWYLYARRGGVIGRAPARFRDLYGGMYPLQVMSVFHPEGGALGLYTEDTVGVPRFWELSKDEGGVDLSLCTWRREVQPGEHLDRVPVVLRGHTGDWRRSLAIYREWAKGWYVPRVARKDWFRRVFYYQQTNAWTRLRDATGAWRVAEEVSRYRDTFGCLDYLHIFDFGESRTYGRVGDYSHYDELGGLEALRQAVATIREMGVRTGLYIEGYLCDERGVWGRENAAKYDIRREDGSPLLWPGAPTEHMMCPDASGWREHLAATYRRVAGELGPDGMYIDQFGFLNTWKTCWSREHGHPVPWPPLRGEGRTLAAIRDAVPAEIATLTEEVPNDLHATLQDGALAYSVTSADPGASPHRVHLFRFLFPDFKTFQLVQYNHFLDGGWELLKYPFFNGEGYWLHGPTQETYCEEALVFLRDAFRVLHTYSDAFCSEDVEALAPTECPTVFANRFGSGDTVVWTLFNGGYSTYRGPVLRVRHRRGAVYRDAFTGAVIEPEVARGQALLRCTLAPRGVGCLAASRE
ncbi:MAG: hypothetical protein JXR77_09665 [Lentisphaeria bacterium]|nr:hypothetical protein [Lentisphaeria bacterium]